MVTWEDILERFGRTFGFDWKAEALDRKLWRWWKQDFALYNECGYGFFDAPLRPQVVIDWGLHASWRPVHEHSAGGDFTGMTSDLWSWLPAQSVST